MPWRYTFAALLRSAAVFFGIFLSIDCALGHAAADEENNARPDPSHGTDHSEALNLFNGRDLTGWVVSGGDPKAWRIEQAEIVTRGTGWATSSWLFTEKNYSDFLLRLEFQTSAGVNSGIGFNAITGDKTPLEIQLQDDTAPKYQNSATHTRTGALYGLALDRPANLKPVGSWNSIEIERRGKALRVDINGQNVLTTNLDKFAPFAEKQPALRRASGRIGLQSHTGTIRFRNVRLQDLTPHGPTLVLDAGGHTDGVTGLAFTPDGRKLISASRDKTIRIWDVNTGSMLRVLRLPIGPGQAGALWSIAVAPDGDMLAAAGVGVEGTESSVYLIGLASGQIERALKGHAGTIMKVVFSPDGNRLASGGEDNLLRIWNVRTGQAEQVLQGHTGRINDISFAPDGRRVVSSANEGNCARVWSLDTQKQISVLKDVAQDAGKWCRSLDWSPDGQTIATGSYDRCVRLWSPDGTLKKRYGPLTEFSSEGGVTFSPDSRSLLLNSWFLDCATGAEGIRFRQHLHGSFQNIISPDASLAATGGFHGNELSLWKTADGSLLHRLQGKGRTNWSAGWSPDGETIAWGNTGQDSSNNSLQPLERAFRLAELAFSDPPDDKFLRRQSSRGSLTVERTPRLNSLTVKDGQQTVSTLKQASLYIKCWTLLPGYDLAAAAGVFGVTLFDTKTGVVVRTFQGHSGDVRAVSASPSGRFILSAASDQTLRIWSTNRDEPLASLFFAGEDWIAWTPEGYYAASPNGEKLMGWQVSDGPSLMGIYYPAERFHKTFYRPDVIQRLLASGSLERALAAADETAGKSTRRTEIAEVLPPKVKITSPSISGQKVTEATFEIKAVASSVGGRPVTSLRLLVDGRPYGGEASLRTLRNAAAGEVHEGWSINLPPGLHRLAVIAASAVSQALSEEVEVLVTSDALPAGDVTSSLHLLAVGINDYPGGLKLDCAAPDATAIEETFRTKSIGLYKVQSTLLLNERATRRRILEALDALAKRAKAGDVAVVFYAGHGDCKLAGQFYLLPVDVRVNQLAQTGISGDEVRRSLARLPCTALLVMDCCYAGSFDAGKKKRALPAEAGDLVRELVRDDEGLVVMCGASKDQESGEEARLGHGYFTQALVEGLGGKAASRRDGLVYLSGLQVYVEERVRELSTDEQFPTIGKPTLIRSFPLSKP